MKEQVSTQEKIGEEEERIKKIKELKEKCKDHKSMIRELDELIRNRIPAREQIKLDLDALTRLKIEQEQVAQDFLVINVIRSIVSPGKGIRKELIAIYMDEIRSVANQLLGNTFGGKLYLEDFLITDKEFVIPYMYNGTLGSDVSYASSAQQAMIASALSLAILSRMVSKYTTITLDEIDGPLNPGAKSDFIPMLIRQMDYIGVNQVFFITQTLEYYTPYQPLVLAFPGAEVTSKTVDVIDV